MRYIANNLWMAYSVILKMIENGIKQLEVPVSSPKSYFERAKDSLSSLIHLPKIRLSHALAVLSLIPMLSLPSLVKAEGNQTVCNPIPGPGSAQSIVSPALFSTDILQPAITPEVIIDDYPKEIVRSVKANEAHEQGIRGKGATIYIIDSAVEEPIQSLIDADGGSSETYSFVYGEDNEGKECTIPYQEIKEKEHAGLVAQAANAVIPDGTIVFLTSCDGVCETRSIVDALKFVQNDQRPGAKSVVLARNIRPILSQYPLNDTFEHRALWDAFAATALKANIFVAAGNDNLPIVADKLEGEPKFPNGMLLIGTSASPDVAPVGSFDNGKLTKAGYSNFSTDDLPQSVADEFSTIEVSPEAWHKMYRVDENGNLYLDTIGGTSTSAPLLAAVSAQLNQARIEAGEDLMDVHAMVAFLGKNGDCPGGLVQIQIGCKVNVRKALVAAGMLELTEVLPNIRRVFVPLVRG